MSKYYFKGCNSTLICNFGQKNSREHILVTQEDILFHWALPPKEYILNKKKLSISIGENNY